MSEIKYLKVKKIIAKQLSIIMNNSKTKETLKNEIFLKAVIKNVSILKEVESLEKTDQNKIWAYKFLDRINVFLSVKQKFIAIELPKNEVDLEDEVKFLDSLSINLFNKTLEEIKDSFSGTDEESQPKKVDNQKIVGVIPRNSAKEDYRDISYQQKNNQYNYGNPGDYKETIINQMATKRLMDEIRSGKIYIYDSRPKFVPIIKHAVSIFYGFIALLYLALIIFTLYINSSGIAFTFFGTPVPPATTRPELNLFKHPVFSWSNILFPALFVVFFPYLAFKNLKGIKNNDNLKYSMSVFLLTIFTFLGIFSLVSSFSNNPFLIIDIAASNPVGTQNINLLDVARAYFILNIISSSFTIFGIIFIIPYMVLKPKQDVKLQQELLEQYKSEIRSSDMVK